MANKALFSRAGLRWFATVWVICLIVASLQPVRIPNTKEPGHFYRHQIEHLLAFGATGLIFLGLSRSRREDWKAAAAVVLLGTAIEIAQYAIYRMPFGFEWWDVREDTIGAVLALIVDRSTGVRRWLISGQR